MKYALLAVVLLAAFFIWRHKRRQRQRELQQQQAQRAAAERERQLGRPVPMTSCRHCGLHLPLAEATHGKLGHYCGPEHRQHAED